MIEFIVLFLPQEKTVLYVSSFQIKKKFFEIAGFPNVIALVDGTQIRIKTPSEHEDSYVNRKGQVKYSVHTYIQYNFE